MKHQWNDGTKKTFGNCFDWRGPSQTLDQYGRIKTQRQMLLDATRVNRQEPLCAKHDTDKTQRMQKAAI